jgi:hypothetical protein
MSCHNSGGAPQALAALAGVAQADPSNPRSAINPFGDTISNQYDLLSRGSVVDAFSQFDTGNSSHHAVRGARYTANTLTAAQFQNISSYNAAITENPAGNGPTGTAVAGKGYKGFRSTPNLTVGTIYQAGAFTALYTVLGSNTPLADNVTMHCGDCHTVGQFKANYATNADGTKVNPAIGAHGSENEYMLRKPDGSENHISTSPAKDALVCYLCHAKTVYSTNWTGTGGQGYPGEGGHAGVSGAGNNNCNGDYNENPGLVGHARFNNLRNGVLFSTISTNTLGNHQGTTGGGNIFAIKCLNCHNASDNKTFGGIHGNANNASYTTYSAANNGPTGTVNGSGKPFTAVQKKPYRFLPGLGNFRYNGGNSAAQWTQRSFQSGAAVKQGCYTLNGASVGAGPTFRPTASPTLSARQTAASTPPLPTAGAFGGFVATDNGIFGSWGACSDHGGSSVSGVSETVDRTILRPLTY